MTQFSATIRGERSTRTSRIPSKRNPAQLEKRPLSTIPRPLPLVPSAATTTKSPPRKPANNFHSSYVAASPSTFPSPCQPATPKPNSIAARREPSTRLLKGPLTPGNVHSRASSISQGNPTSTVATPPAPQKRRSGANDGKNGDRAAADSNSLFMQGHVGEHCIKGALVHKLACSHKIMTVKVEACASNCVRPLAKHLQEHASQVTEEAFVCSACVEQHVQSHREAKRALFEQIFKATEQQMMAFPPGWLDKQRSYWEKVWGNDTVMEREAFGLLGRRCVHFGENVMATYGKKEKIRSTAVPFPLRRPKPRRASDGMMPGSVLEDKTVKYRTQRLEGRETAGETAAWSNQ